MIEKRHIEPGEKLGVLALLYREGEIPEFFTAETMKDVEEKLHGEMEIVETHVPGIWMARARDWESDAADETVLVFDGRSSAVGEFVLMKRKGDEWIDLLEWMLDGMTVGEKWETKEGEKWGDWTFLTQLIVDRRLAREWVKTMNRSKRVSGYRKV